jgi:hypothetical protein
MYLCIVAIIKFFFLFFFFSLNFHEGGSGLNSSKGGNPLSSPNKMDSTIGGGGHKERDALKEEVVSRQKQMKSFILTGAKLIA